MNNKEFTEIQIDVLQKNGYKPYLLTPLNSNICVNKQYVFLADIVVEKLKEIIIPASKSPHVNTYDARQYLNSKIPDMDSGCIEQLIKVLIEGKKIDELAVTKENVLSNSSFNYDYFTSSANRIKQQELKTEILKRAYKKDHMYVAQRLLQLFGCAERLGHGAGKNISKIFGVYYREILLTELLQSGTKEMFIQTISPVVSKESMLSSAFGMLHNFLEKYEFSSDHIYTLYSNFFSSKTQAKNTEIKTFIKKHITDSKQLAQLERKFIFLQGQDLSGQSDTNLKTITLFGDEYKTENYKYNIIKTFNLTKMITEIGIPGWKKTEYQEILEQIHKKITDSEPLFVRTNTNTVLFITQHNNEKLTEQIYTDIIAKTLLEIKNIIVNKRENSIYHSNLIGTLVEKNKLELIIESNIQEQNKEKRKNKI